MTPQVEVRPADGVDDGARVGHYDELDERAKHRLPALVAADGATAVDGETEAALADYDLVKFTDYYRVQRVS
jgi:hypothetical protein